MGLGETLRRALPSPANRVRRRAIRRARQIVSPPAAADIETVPGCLSREQGQMLCYLASESPPAAVVEIGSFLGKSTLWLCNGLASARRRGLYAIDPHDGHERPEVETGIRDTYEAFLENVRRRGFDRIVTPVRKRSAEAGAGWSEPIGVLWIDGSHDYPDVLDDLRRFSPHVVPEGYIAMHDTSGRHFPGVRKALREFFEAAPDFARLTGFHNMEVFQRRPR